MASKTWPRRISEKSSVPRRQLRCHTDPIIRSDRHNTRKSEESLERASKRIRRSESPEEAEVDTVGVKTSNEKKRSRGLSNPAEDDQEPKKRSRKTHNLSEGPSHLACSSDAPSKRSRNTPSPCEGPCHQDCSSYAPRKRSRKTHNPSAGPSHQVCSSDTPRKRSRNTPSPSEGHSYPALSNVRAYKCIGAFKKRYSVEEMLGKGSYGSVFAGERKRDNLPVAIKEIPQQDVERTPVLVDGNISMMPLEVALLLRLKPAESESSAVVSLLDWFDLEDVLILVLERPDPCIDMYDYIDMEQRHIEEPEAKIITRQLVDALIEIHSKGVFHGDIKADNILIETSADVPRVRVIDFGCGTFLSGQTLNAYTKRDAFLCSPPEMWENSTFHPEATTVWQLGLVVYELLHSSLPFQTGFGIMKEGLCINENLSHDCQNFIENCLPKNPDNRPTLAMLKNHPWLK